MVVHIGPYNCLSLLLINFPNCLLFLRSSSHPLYARRFLRLAFCSFEFSIVRTLDRFIISSMFPSIIIPFIRPFAYPTLPSSGLLFVRNFGSFNVASLQFSYSYLDRYSLKHFFVYPFIQSFLSSSTWEFGPRTWTSATLGSSDFAFVWAYVCRSCICPTFGIRATPLTFELSCFCHSFDRISVV